MVIYLTLELFRFWLILLDDPYSLEQLRDPRMNLSIVKPLVDKLYEANDVSMGMRRPSD